MWRRSGRRLRDQDRAGACTRAQDPFALAKVSEAGYISVLYCNYKCVCAVVDVRRLQRFHHIVVMLRIKRRQARPLPVIADTPPAPAAIDAKIASLGGSTVAIDATQHRLQAAKKMPTPSLSQIVEQKTWENGRLRRELAFHQSKQAAALYLLEEVRLVEESLRQALANFERLDAEADADADAEPDAETGDSMASGRV